MTTLRVVISYVASHEVPEDLRDKLRALADTVAGELAQRGVAPAVVNSGMPEVDPASCLDGAAGVVILGGFDVDPSTYGQDVTVPTLFMPDRAADEYEMALVRNAASADLPVFGICRGSQIVNVAFGGTLIQDLGPGIHVAEVFTEQSNVEDVWTDHDVWLSEGSRLRKAIGRDRISVRVGHHQAVDFLGAGLLVSARAEDGVVEAVEGTDRWILGVQWHPELPEADPVAFGQLLDAFLEAIIARNTAQELAPATTF